MWGVTGCEGTSYSGLHRGDKDARAQTFVTRDCNGSIKLECAFRLWSLCRPVTVTVMVCDL